MKKKSKSSFYENNLLSSLQPKDLDLLAPHLTAITVQAGDVLYEPGDAVLKTYFPCGPTMVSYMVLLEDAKGVETVLIGKEGAIGGIVSQGRLPAYCRAIVQFPGDMLVMKTAHLEEAKEKSITLRHFFARYADCVLAQIFQSVACNASHTIEQRMAKWLVAAMDRTGKNEIALTQENLANLVGVGRSYVSRVIGKMKKNGTLRTERGKLIVPEIDALQDIYCSCNELVKKHFDEVLSGVYPDANPS